MQPALDSSILDHLISLGRERGHLTTEDLKASLPIETMSTEEIASIVVHLEETGVPVELEDALLSPNPKPVLPQRTAEIIPFPGPRSAHRKPSKASSLKPINPSPADAVETNPQPSRMAHWAVAAVGGLALIAFLLLIVATAS